MAKAAGWLVGQGWRRNGTGQGTLEESKCVTSGSHLRDRFDPFSLLKKLGRPLLPIWQEGAPLYSPTPSAHPAHTLSWQR